MPWCPNCKTEYRKGFTVCSDCSSPLVEKLVDNELIPFFQAEEKSIAEKLIRYFDYSGLTSDIRYHEENQVYVVSIPVEKQMEAKKLYQAFYFVERERAEKESCRESSTLKDCSTTKGDMLDDLSNDRMDQLTTLAEHIEITEQASAEDALLQNEIATAEDTVTENITKIDDSVQEAITEDASLAEDPPDYNPNDEPATYVLKSEQYKDLNATVWIFLFFGIVGILVLILNLIDIFNFINGIIPTGVMGALFLFFLYVGISTNSKAKKVHAEIEEENRLTEKINHWLKVNITDDFLTSIHNASISSELNYMKATETIQNMLIKEFGPQNHAYLDRLIEDFYTKTFDENTEEAARNE